LQYKSFKKMKHSLFCIFFIIAYFSIEAIGQNNDTIPQVFYYENGKKSSEGFLRNGKPDGYWRTWYPSGVLRSEGNRMFYQLDGLWLFFDEQGDTLQKINYANGLKNGYYYGYEYSITDNEKKGGLISKELYLNDVRQGLSYYYENGYLIKTINYRDGKKHGIGYEYDKDGRIIVVLEYANDFLINRERVNRYNSDGQKQGIWKDFYNDGRIKQEITYINDTISGYIKAFDNSGNVMSIIRVAMGDTIKAGEEDTLKRFRFVEEYYDTGQLKFRGGYFDDKPVGMHKEYSIDGTVITGKEYNESNKLYSMGLLDNNDRKQGSWRYLYEDGTTRAEGDYKNNRKSGNWIYYYPDQKVEQKGRFIADRPTGKWIWYFSNGQIWREEEMDRGKEEGKFIEYDKNGNIVLSGQYLEGERHGEWYYNAGDQTEKGEYQYGLREGIWQHYYPTGKLNFEGNFVQGYPDGKHTWYYENGRKKEEGNYVMGVREKKWIKWDLEGNPYLIITFKNDYEYKINRTKINLHREAKR